MRVGSAWETQKQEEYTSLYLATSEVHTIFVQAATQEYLWVGPGCYMGRFLNRKHQLIGRGCNVLARLLVLTTIWLIRHIATHCYT